MILDPLDPDLEERLSRNPTDLIEIVKNLKSIFYVSNDKQALKSGSVTCLHWRDFLSWFRNI